MKKLTTTLLIAAGTLASVSAASAETYTVTITNNMASELLAPVLATASANDRDIFRKNYVTRAAEKQILTGDPAALVKRIGRKGASVGHGSDGPPKVLLAPGKSITFKVKTRYKSLRVIAMVAPTMTPDNFVTNTIDLTGIGTAHSMLNRYDIGHDEKSKHIFHVSDNAASITVVNQASPMMMADNKKPTMMDDDKMKKDTMSKTMMKDGKEKMDETMMKDGKEKMDETMMKDGKEKMAETMMKDGKEKMDETMMKDGKKKE